MQYKSSFIVLVIICSFSGILISILNNDVISLDKENNVIKNQNNNKDSNEEKNKLIDNNDFIKEEDTNLKEEEDNQEDINNEIEKNNNEEKKEKEENENSKEKEENENNKEKEENEIKDMEKEVNNLKYNNIYVALSIDAKYLYPCLVFLTSLLENRKSTTKYIIIILTSKSIDSTSKSKFNSIIEKYGKDIVDIKFFDMKDDFKGAITGSHISLAAYYRIALPSLLPNVDKIIYTDSDVINFVDLTEMYYLEFKEKMYFMGMLDNIGLLNELKSLGIYVPKYMNDGIMLMNLKAIREDGIEQKIRDFIKTHYLDHHDQTAINGVCHNNWQILSVKYACFNFGNYESIVNFNNKQDKRFRYSDTELMQAIYEPTLLHFVGWTKPWEHGYTKTKAEYWWHYAKKCIFYKEILNKYGFTDAEVETLLKKIPKDGGLLKRNYG